MVWLAHHNFSAERDATPFLPFQSGNRPIVSSGVERSPQSTDISFVFVVLLKAPGLILPLGLRCKHRTAL